VQANPRTITALFESTQRYVVPMFQRHYVWTQKRQPGQAESAGKSRQRVGGASPLRGNE